MSTENTSPADVQAQPAKDQQSSTTAANKADAKDAPRTIDNAGSRNDGKEYGTAKTPAGGAHSNPSRQDDIPKKPA